MKRISQAGCWALAASLFAGFAPAQAQTPPALERDRQAAETFLPDALVRDLEIADSFEILSLSPDPVSAPEEGQDVVQSYPVLGSLRVDDIETRGQVLLSVRKSVTDAPTAPTCFKPRHGIRARTAAGTVEIVISHECMKAVLQAGDVRREALVRDLSTPLFNALMDRAGTKRDPSADGD